jgi:hypothetical protein
MRNLMLLILLTITLVTSCAPVPEITATPTETIPTVATASPTPLPTATATPAPTPTPLPLDGQQTQYFIEASIDYYNRFIAATSRVIYTNRTTSHMDEILFVVYPKLFLDSFNLVSVTDAEGNPYSNTRWEGRDGDKLIIPLVTTLQPGEQIEMVYTFNLSVPDQGGIYSHSGRQLNLSYWFPMIPPFDETKGWIAHDIHSIIGEHFVFEVADFDVKLQFTDRRENFTIAAGAIPVESNEVLHYQLKLARVFVLSISDSFMVTEREVNGIKIHSYTFPEHAAVSEVVADVAADSISLFSELFGSYKRDLLSIVEFNFDIGMEFDGLIFLSPYFYMHYPGNPQSNIHVYTSHEVAHQWFFSQVGNDQAKEPWLDEALATYSEVLFYEHFYPELLDWWWLNYIDFHQPSGPIDVSIYFGGTLHEYRNQVYRNGARFLQDLRDTIGDEVFFIFLRAYVNEFRYEIATADGFWAVLTDHTDKDLKPLIDKYFLHPPNLP